MINPTRKLAYLQLCRLVGSKSHTTVEIGREKLQNIVITSHMLLNSYVHSLVVDIPK